ncbi:hypothetical protein pb186bvf_011044 [Paramecium bursaria]
MKRLNDQQQLGILSARVNDLTIQMEKLEEIIRTQKDQISNLQTSRGEEDILKLQEENLILKETVSVLSKDKEDIQSYYDELLQHRSMDSQGSDFQYMIEQLEQKLQIIIEENDRLKKQPQEVYVWQTQNIQLQDQLQQLIRENQYLCEKYEGLQEVYSKQTFEKDRIMRELITLKQSFNQAKILQSRQVENMNQKEIEFSEIVNQLSYLQNQIHTLSQSNNELKRLNEEKQNIIDNLTQQEKLIDHQNQYELRYHLLDKEYKVIKKELETLQQQKQNLMIVLAERSEEHHKLIQQYK